MHARRNSVRVGLQCGHADAPTRFCGNLQKGQRSWQIFFKKNAMEIGAKQHHNGYLARKAIPRANGQDRKRGRPKDNNRIGRKERRWKLLASKSASARGMETGGSQIAIAVIAFSKALETPRSPWTS